MDKIKLYACIVLLIFVTACSQAETKVVKKVKEVPVQVIEVQEKTREKVLKLLGTIEADREMKVSFKIGGKLKRLSFKEGDLVKKGKPLAELERTELLARKEKAMENRNKAKRDLARMEKLHQRKIVPLSSLEDAQTLLISAGAELKIVEDSLKNSVIFAPFTGRITKKISEAGEISTPGMPVAMLTEMNPILVKAALPDNFISKIRKGQTAVVRVDSYPNVIFNGVIARLETRADPLSRTFSMEIRMANRDEKLRPGMIANVTVPYEKKERVILIPLDAVIGFGSQPSVFVVRHAIARRRIIKTGEITGAHVEVLQGLNAGETIVVSGQEYLSSGNRVLVSKSMQKLAELR